MNMILVSVIGLIGAFIGLTGFGILVNNNQKSYIPFLVLCCILFIANFGMLLVGIHRY